MTVITYLVGKTVDSRQKLLFEKMASSGETSALHLVPNSGRVMELETDPEFWLKKSANTLTGLIQRIFDEDIRNEKYNNRILIDRSIRAMLVKRIIEKRAQSPERLLFFDSITRDENRDADFPGIYRSIEGFFSQLIMNNYEDTFAHDLAGRIERQGYESPESGEDRYAMESDLLWLLGDFEEIKNEMNCYDEDDIYTGVRDFLRNGGKPCSIRNINALIIDGFTFFTRIEEEMLFNLIRLTEQVWWLIDYNGQALDPVRDFKALAFGNAGPAPCEIYETRDAEAYRACYSIAALMDRLEKTGIECDLIRGDEETYPDYRSIKNGMRIGRFPSQIQEVRAIASEIKRIIHDNGIDVSSELGRIRVIFPELDDYSGPVNEVFTEYGLPFSLTRGIPLPSHPISDIFLRILTLPVNGFEREDIFRLFSSNLIRINNSACKSPLDPDMPDIIEFLLPGDDPVKASGLIETLYKDNSGNGSDVHLFDLVLRRTGITLLGNDLNELEKGGLSSVRKYYAASIDKTRDSNEKTALRTEYYGFILQCLLLKGILNSIKSIAEQKDPLKISKIFTEILDTLGFPANILLLPNHENVMKNYVSGKIQKRDIKAYSLLYDLILSTGKELLIVKRLFNIQGGRELLLAFNRLFMERLNRSYLLDERNPNVIRVSQWLEIRGRSFDYIFAGGLTADKFPLTDNRDFMLKNIPERILRMPDAVDESRHLFAHILKNFRKGLFFSYPEYRNEKETQPSQMILDLEAVTAGNSMEPESGVLRWKACPYITSPEDLLNSGFKKSSESKEPGGRLFDLSNIILRDRGEEERIIRGVRTIASRYAMDGLFEYDGIVTDAQKFDGFLKERKNLFSASQLDLLANCPMRYLFSRVYGIGDMVETGPDASPLAAGDFIHEILGIFFGELSSQRMNVFDIGLAAAFLNAAKTVNDYLQKGPLIDGFEYSEFLKRLFLEGLDRDIKPDKNDFSIREGIFPMLLRFEETAMSDRIPAGIEEGFGFNEEDKVVLGRMNLRGFIDRYDTNKNYPDRIYLYDYKTGRVHTTANIKKGLSFQLPVYIRALRSRSNSEKSISASFYSLKREKLMDKPLASTISDRCEGEGLDISGIILFDEYADQLYSLIERGRFHHSAEGLECDYCEFRYACHMDSRRMEHLLKSCGDPDIYSGAGNLLKWNRVDKFRKDWKKEKEYMEKAFSLKRESDRRKNYEKVMEFRNEMENDRSSLPFLNEYINDLMDEIDEFERNYLKMIKAV